MHHEWKKLERKAICYQPWWWRTLLLVQTVLQYPWCGIYLLKSTWIRSCLICKISTNVSAKYQQMYPLNKADFPHAPGLVIWQLCLCLWQSTSPFRPTMHVALCRSVSHCVTVCYGMLQRVVNSVLCQPIRIYVLLCMLQLVAVCCNVIQTLSSIN